MLKRLLLVSLILISLTTLLVDARWGHKYEPKTDEQTVSWNDCPKGLTYDPYPGECKDYIDTDHDGYCDHSEPPPWERSTATNFQTLQTSKFERYNVIPLTALGIVLIVTAEIVERFKGRWFARYWWNVILIALAVPSALIGFLLIFLDSRTIRNYDLIFWHVEFSIIASVLCLYHIAKRYRSLLKIPRSVKK